MATITTNVDDLTGDTLPEGNPTTRITVVDPRGPVSVELDMSDTTYKGLLKALEKYVSKGREVTPQKVTTDTEAREFASEARKWAIANGVQPPVSERGAVPQRALDAYREHLASLES